MLILITVGLQIQPSKGISNQRANEKSVYN